MEIQQLVRELKVQNNSKIVLLVADGLGGLPMAPGGLTELESAKTPNLDALARHAGTVDPDPAGHHARQRAGTPGTVRLRSAEMAHRPRALEATGVGFKLTAKDVALARQLRHAGPVGQHRRPPRRTHCQRGKLRRWRYGYARSRSPAWKSSSSRSRSTASA